MLFFFFFFLRIRENRSGSISHFGRNRRQNIIDPMERMLDSCSLCRLCSLLSSITIRSRMDDFPKTATEAWQGNTSKCFNPFRLLQHEERILFPISTSLLYFPLTWSSLPILRVHSISSIHYQSYIICSRPFHYVLPHRFLALTI